MKWQTLKMPLKTENGLWLKRIDSVWSDCWLIPAMHFWFAHSLAAWMMSIITYIKKDDENRITITIFIRFVSISILKKNNSIHFYSLLIFHFMFEHFFFFLNFVLFGIHFLEWTFNRTLKWFVLMHCIALYIYVIEQPTIYRYEF